MASENQIAANRRNAQKSTGPRTPDGKAIVSQNALKHGLRSKSFLLGFEDEKKEYPPLHASLREEWQPVGAAEELLVERMAIAHFKLTHLESVENIQLLLLGEYNTLRYIWPQQARLERTFDKAAAQLHALQQERARQSQRESAALPEPAPPKPVPAPAGQAPAAPPAKLGLFVQKNSSGRAAFADPPAPPPLPLPRTPAPDPQLPHTLAQRRSPPFDTCPPQVINV